VICPRAPRSAIEIIAAMTAVDRARNSHEHRRRKDRSTAFDGADGTGPHVKNKIVIGDAGHIRA
jgi:hypothetical protein